MLDMGREEEKEQARAQGPILGITSSEHTVGRNFHRAPISLCKLLYFPEIDVIGFREETRTESWRASGARPRVVREA